jgi:hypothetical protein
MRGKIEALAMSLLVLAGCSGRERIHLSTERAVHPGTGNHSRRDLTLAGAGALGPGVAAQVELVRTPARVKSQRLRHSVPRTRVSPVSFLTIEAPAALGSSALRVRTLEFKGAPAIPSSTGAAPLDPGQTATSIPASTSDSGGPSGPSFEAPRSTRPHGFVGGGHGGTCRGRGGSRRIHV